MNKGYYKVKIEESESEHRVTRNQIQGSGLNNQCSTTNIRQDWQSPHALKEIVINHVSMKTFGTWLTSVVDVRVLSVNLV